MRAILSFTILLLLLYGAQASPSTDSDVSSEIDVFDYMDVNNSASDKSLKCINWGTGIPSVPSPADIPTEPIRNQPSKLRQRSSRQRNNAIRKSTIAPKTASSSVTSGSMPVESIS